MKRFLKNICLFFFFILLFFSFENFMSTIYSDYQRPGTNLFYDTFYYANENDSSYYVEEELSRKPKETNLITDKFGNRNTKLYDSLDIMLCGDSFTSLVMLKQDETIHHYINSESNLHANSMRTKGIYGFDNNINYISTRYSKPKLFVYEIVERNISNIYAIDSAKIYPFQKTENVGDFKWLSKVKKFVNEGLDLPTLRYFQYEFRAKGESFPKSEIDSDFYFLEGKNVHRYSEEEIIRIADELEKMKKLSEVNGIQFVFLPIPNKETIYYEKVVLNERPDNLDRLFSELDNRNIPYIDVLHPLLESKEDTYLSGDSHINPNGSFIIASEIIKYYYNSL